MTHSPNEKFLYSEYPYKGKIVTLRKDEVLLSNGKKASREVVEHVPAAVILPVSDQGGIYLIQQYRTAVGDYIWEAPAGCLEKGEDLLTEAQRELREETGFSALSGTSLGGVYMTPGFCTEFMHLYLAQGLTAGETDMDADEVIETKLFSVQDIETMIADGDLIDGKTILAFHQAKAYLFPQDSTHG